MSSGEQGPPFEVLRRVDVEHREDSGRYVNSVRTFAGCALRDTQATPQDERVGPTVAGAAGGRLAPPPASLARRRSKGENLDIDVKSEKSKPISDL